MAKNGDWATFPPQNSSEKKDEGWGDFGGFETALPVTNPQASNTTGLISWAALSTEPQVSVDTTESQPYANLPDSQQQSPGISSLPSQPSELITPEVSNMQLEQDVETTSSSAPSFSQSETSTESPEFPVLLDRVATNSGQYSDLTEDLKEQKQKTEKAEKAIDELERKLTVEDQEKQKFKKDLEELTKNNQYLEKESKSIKENLEKQQEKYSKLQKEHQTQIHEIRQAGHDALAIIVEEYKELCKQAVLEQQEKSQAELHLFLENERHKFKEGFNQQQESFEKAQSEERASNDERVKNVLQAEQERNKLVLESSLSKTQEDSKTALQLAVKESMEKGQEAIKEAVAKEKETHRKAMEDMEKLLQEEREKFKLSLEDTINEERKQSKITIEEALAEERNKSRDAVSRSIEETKAIMNEYTQQKLEAESKVQQKQFMAIDLFLECARTQLNNLIEGQHPS